MMTEREAVIFRSADNFRFNLSFFLPKSFVVILVYTSLVVLEDPGGHLMKVLSLALAS